MKTKHFLSFIAMAIGMGSCTNDLVDETSPLMGKRDVIAVSVDNADTRTEMDGYDVVWSEDDAIGIFVGSTNNEYGLISEPGTTSGEFQSKGLVVASAETVKEAAYFPYVQGATWANNVISTTLPSTYGYAEGTNNNAVMAALMAEDAQSSISFQNAGALYAITVENIPEGYDKAVMTYLDAEDNVGIAGAATITFVDGVPTLAVPDADNAIKTITITFTGSGDKIFYFPMPVKASGYANKLQFSLQGEGKEAISAPEFTKEPARSNLYAVTLTLDNVSGGIVSEANDINAANEALAKDAVTSVAVKDATDTEAITIPAKSAESAAVEHTIDLSKATLPNGAVSIVVEEATGEGATVEKLTVIVSEGASAGSYTINAPGTTVTIQGANGTVIETIEATTAEHTLIIGEGVTINQLNINGGNIKMEGGKVNTITNNTNDILYITNIAGELPTALSDDIIVVYQDTEHAVVLNAMYSADNIADLMSYCENVLNTTQLSFTLSEGKYSEVVDVTGGKDITFAPKVVGQEVSIAGLDHQSNGKPSNVVVKNITLDNTLQTEGWFIGTAQNIKPCVGAWGGDFTFDGCKFIVEGTSGKETGVMTWWIVNKMSLIFTDCTFEGKDNHESARAMQIYGNADMTVTGCTFNTYKDYSLKYVATEGNVAIFEGNKVYNSKYFVQIGSAPYAGKNYTVNINNTTLGENVNNYFIDNEEGQMLYVDGSLVVSTPEQLAACLTADKENISVTLADNIDLPITSLGSQTPGSGEYKLGGSNTNNITIDLNDKILNITTTYWSAIGAKNDNATINIKNGTMTSSQTTGTWNSYDLTFANCDYVLEDVVFDKAVALANAGKSVTMNGVTINETHDYYALWITAEGQTVELEGLTINSEGRGIKIDDQYVDTPLKVTLKVSDATFKNAKKAAILVKSPAGADITLYNINIEGVTADSANAVWCDEDAKDYDSLITVVGGTKKIEGE